MSVPQRLRPIRAVLAALLLLAFALPLFAPPAPVRVLAADASFLARLFPGVPPLWVAARLVALALGALLLSGAFVAARQPFRAAATGTRPGKGALRWLALGVALAHAVSALWVTRLGAAGQAAFVLMLGVPALLLAWPLRGQAPRASSGRGISTAVPVAALILLWTVWRLIGDLYSPRAADVIDIWRVLSDIEAYLAQGKNFLVDGLDPDLPGVPATPLFFQGLPLFQSGLVPVSFQCMQGLQILWLAASAIGVAALARLLVGARAMLIAVAVFLFAPYIRFMPLNAGPYIVGPMYATAIALCAVAACRRRSEAALAALGAVSGLALSYPGVAPTIALFGAMTAWYLRRDWRDRWLGCAAGLASFAAAGLGTVPYIYTLGGMAAEHLRMQGVFTLLEGVAQGQLPIGGTVELAASSVVRRPLDIVAGTLLSPFANARIAIRLWGDALFDPVGTVLIAVGVAACLRSARRRATARLLLLFLAAALAPAFLSNVDRPNMTRALVLPVPAALLAAAGFDVVRRQVGGGRGRRWAAAAVAAAVCVGGVVLFDVVNPRILGASSLGLMFRALQGDAAGRAVVVNYPSGFSPHVQWLFVDPVARYAGKQPIAVVEDTGREIPSPAGVTKDLLFWSPGADVDLKLSQGVCAQWPGATLYEIWDESGLARVLAARVGGGEWAPAAAAARWHSDSCPPSG